MNDEQKGFTIRVHGDVPQEALDGLVAAIPVRTVIIGAGPHATAAPTADDVNQTFGAGSEVATMAHAALKSKPYETWQEREARRDQESFDKATKVDAKDYGGWVSWPGRGDDNEYFESVDALRKYCTKRELALPPFVWACTRAPFKLDADHILDQALEEHHDGARGKVSAAEEERLQTLLDEWCAAQGIVSWHEDRTRAVMLSTGDNVTDQICGLDRKALESALEWQAQEWVEEFMIRDMARLSNKPIKSCFAAIVDPEKLAGIIGETLRGFGFADLSDTEFAPSHEARVKAQDDQIKVYQRVNGAHKLGWLLFTMPSARDLALRILQLPEGTTTEDASREVEKRS